MATDPILIRKSPVVIVKNLILLEFIALAAYFLAAVLANYSELYQSFTGSQIVSYEIAKFLFIAFGELLLIGFIFLRWYYAVYIVQPGTLTIERGIFLKRKKVTPFEHPWIVSIQLGPLSQLFSYGALIVRDKTQKNRAVLRHIASPDIYKRMITDWEKDVLRERSEHASSPENADELLASRERENLEFKSSLRWDARENKVNRELEKSALKTAAAFLNSDGGHMVLGVDDMGAASGLDQDYATLRKPGQDGFENHFTNIFKESIGPDFRQFLKLSFHAIGQKEICVVRVFPATSPAYMKFNGEEVFYIRTGNSTTALPVSKAADYIRERWKK